MRAKLLERAAQRRAPLAAAARGERPTTAYRLFHRDGDGDPGVAVDVYDRWLVAHLFEARSAAREAALFDALIALGYRGVYVKRHPRQKNELAGTSDESLTPPAPVRGAPAPHPLVVYEHGVPFGVRLDDGFRTGLFLDQRENRHRVHEAAADQRVLNLFSYTGSFSVAALAGGARAALCVDSAARCLERARENIARIQATDRHRVLCDDALAVLRRLSRRGERFDLVIADPPSYSTARGRRFRVRRDYVALCRAALAVLSPGGVLLACLNHHGTRAAELRRFVEQAVAAEDRRVLRTRALPAAIDFPRGPAPAELKARWSVVS